MLQVKVYHLTVTCLIHTLPVVQRYALLQNTIKPVTPNQKQACVDYVTMHIPLSEGKTIYIFTQAHSKWDEWQTREGPFIFPHRGSTVPHNRRGKDHLYFHMGVVQYHMNGMDGRGKDHLYFHTRGSAVPHVAETQDMMLMLPV